MMTILLPLLTAMVAGFLHALEPDHMAAVTTFVSRRPHPLRALGFGVRWGMGHSAAVLGVGIVLVALDLRIPSRATQGLEFAVGAMLFFLGAALLWSALHTRIHLHASPPEEAPIGHHHEGGSFWIGIAHGLAGTAPLMAILPVTLIPSTSLVLLYLLLFGLGTIGGMALYALCVGVVFSRAGRHLPGLGALLRISTAVGSSGLGIFWMIAAIRVA